MSEEPLAVPPNAVLTGTEAALWTVVAKNERVNRPKIAEIVASLERVSPGSFEFIEIAPPPKRRRLRDPSI
jgi:hypothetical protein